MQTGARLTLEHLLIFHRSHAGRTHAHRMACVRPRKRNSDRATRSSVRRAPSYFQVLTCRLAARQHGTTSLVLRDLPLKERFTVVDTASIPLPTPTPLRNPIRARAEKCLLTVRAREKSAFCGVGSRQEK